MYAVIEEGKVGRGRRHDSESIEIVAQKEWKVVEGTTCTVNHFVVLWFVIWEGEAETRLLSAKC